MSYRDNLIFTQQSLTNPDPTIPAFVLQQVRFVLDWHESDEDTFFYATTAGCITVPYKDISKHIMIWIASHDHVVHSIYPGGSSTWIQAESHYLSFKAIPDLPPLQERDPSVWWIVSDTEEAPWPRVVRIQIVSEEQMTRPFPDLDL